MLVPERLRQQSWRHVHPVEASKPPCRTSNVIIQTRDGAPVNVKRGESATLLCLKSQSPGPFWCSMPSGHLGVIGGGNEKQLFPAADRSGRPCLGIRQSAGSGAAA